MADVLVAGAGPTGLTLAIELARRGVAVRIVDRASGPAAGSRGDGLQPRTLEVFEDLGVLDDVLGSGMGAPLQRMRVGDMVVWEGRMAEPVAPRPDVPYPNPWFVPQWRTEQILRERLAELGVRVEPDTELTGLAQHADGVVARLRHAGAESTVPTRYVVGADGASSSVRKALGIGFVGHTDEDLRILLADVRADGLDHELGHGWMHEDNSLLNLTPLASGPDEYVVAVRPGNGSAPEPTLGYLQATLNRLSGRVDVRLHDLTWITVWRPNVRMAQRFAEGRVFLAGDAAHVHPPTGGQGLNTGVQDAYNLGWKLAASLAGAPAELLESYEAERLPAAASVLGLSSALLAKHVAGDSDAFERGTDTHGLDISYRAGPLAVDGGSTGSVQAGDRAPDAPVRVGDGRAVRLFELFAGPRATLLRFGANAPALDADGVPSYQVDDPDGHAARAYGVPDDTAVLVRPDGYLGALTGDQRTLDAYARRVLAPDALTQPTGGQ